MKLAACLSLLLAGCAGYTTSFTVGYEREGRRLDASASFTPTGKQVVRPQRHPTK